MRALIEILIQDYKKDSFEIFRDQIVNILKVESEKQVGLATAAGFDSELWNLNVISEGRDPIELLRNDNGQVQQDKRLIVSVLFYGFNYIEKDGRSSRTQKAFSYNYYIDVYGFANSDSSINDISSDEKAAKKVHWGVKLVRNIFNFSGYSNLGLDDIITSKVNIQGVEMMQPESSALSSSASIVVGRITLNIEGYEDVIENPMDNLDEINAEII